MAEIYDFFQQYHGGDWFTYPVQESDAPHYFDVISSPIDLTTMIEKEKRGEYKSAEEIDADVDLMLRNCLIYNNPGDQFYNVCEYFMRLIFNFCLERSFNLISHEI